MERCVSGCPDRVISVCGGVERVVLSDISSRPRRAL